MPKMPEMTIEERNIHQETINKEIQHEISTNTIYRDCKSTDGILREYESKLDLQ